MFADSSSSGPIFGKNPSTYSRRDARRARKRGGPSAESCVRCLLLFSRTTKKKNKRVFWPKLLGEDVHGSLRQLRVQNDLVLGNVGKRISIPDVMQWLLALYSILYDSDKRFT